MRTVSPRFDPFVVLTYISSHAVRMEWRKYSNAFRTNYGKISSVSHLYKQFWPDKKFCNIRIRSVSSCLIFLIQHEVSETNRQPIWLLQNHMDITEMYRITRSEWLRNFFLTSTWTIILMTQNSSGVIIILPLGDDELASGDWREGEVLFPL
jgi:hypothetical protein